MRIRTASLVVALLAALPAHAQPVRDLGTPLVALTSFDRDRLLGEWYEVAQTPTILERDCHGTTVRIEEREDSRLTFRITCPVGAPDGPILPIEGVMVETDPGVFLVRLIRLPQLGDLPLVVVWDAGAAGVLALAAPRGEIGWIWARAPRPDPAALDAARQALVDQGYRASAIRDVPHAP